MKTKRSDQQELASWLKGFPCNEEQLSSYIMDTFGQFAEEKVLYRGLCSNEPIEIHNRIVSSWTPHKNVAEYFASHGKYKKILCKKALGYSVKKILNYLRDSNQIEDCLGNFYSRFEDEYLIFN